MEKTNSTLKTIRVFGREITRKDGKKFTSYSYTNDGKKFYRVKFTQECENRPSKTGYVLMTVNTKDVSVQKPVKNDTYQTWYLWIKNVVSYQADEEHIAEMDAKRVQEVIDILTDDTNK